MSIRVVVNGAKGRMGHEVVKALAQEPELQLAGEADKDDNIGRVIEHTKADIVVDFTTAHVAFENIKQIIAAGARPVVGTTGLSKQQVAELTALCAEKKLGGLIAPNFSIGAILLIRMASECAKYFPHVEIIELHHDAKVDAPSGTALHTAESLLKNKTKTTKHVQEKMTLEGARGAQYGDIHIHSVRLPGLVAHEEVIFGAAGQTLTLRHDTFHREAFMPGVMLACKKVMSLHELVYGLEHIL